MHHLLIAKANSKQVDNAKDLNVVMPLYNLLEYRNNYLQTWRGLWKYYWDEPALDSNSTIADFMVIITIHLNSLEKSTLLLMLLEGHSNSIEIFVIFGGLLKWH